MLKLFSKIFNTNLGVLITKRIYFYDGKPYIGYVVYRSYIMFGLLGHDRLGVFLTKEEAKNFISLIE